MASRKPLDFEDYREYSGGTNPTKQSEFQDYSSNQNILLTELVQTLVWQPTTAYSVGAIVYCGAGLWARCTTAGTSGTTEPSWLEGNVGDGGAAWTVTENIQSLGSAISTLNAHMANSNNPHSVTKAQVGLGSVVNTGDSATPVSGGATKFTTGGAYIELAKKVDKAQGSGNAGKALVVGSDGNVNTSSVKTINSTSLLGSGNIAITGGHTWTTTTPSSGTGGASSETPAVVVKDYINGMSWYREWSNGWLEQGGYSYASGYNPGTQVALLKTFKDTNYSVMGTKHNNGGSAVLNIFAKNTGSFYAGEEGQGGSSWAGSGYFHWYACGVKS